MKAQQVKNTIIVPTGAKGGFVPKRLSMMEGREAIMTEAVAVYRLFIRSLLDLTDNYVNDQIQKPLEVICYDEDDPYLVVAADKGTATFSDYANEISNEVDFGWGMPLHQEALSVMTIKNGDYCKRRLGIGETSFL